MTLDPAPRRGRPGLDRATVLRRAIELFNQRGYDGTSMGDLARDLGLSKAAIYHHVPSKEHLLEQALDEALDEVTAIVDAAVAESQAGIGDPASRLKAVVRRSVVVLVAHQPAVTLLLRVRGNSEIELAALRRRRELDHQLAQLVRAARDAGGLRADLDPELTSRLIFGTVNSLTEWYSPGRGVEPEQLADAVVEMAFRGLDQQS